ncbi:MAG: hypothetical protein IPH59_12415 [bacterium]|nr:hypothetical protein [bacterium]
MSKLVIRVSLLLLFIMSATAMAVTTIKVSDVENGVTILGQDPSGITLRINVGELEAVPVATKAGAFTMLSAKGFSLSSRVGEPALPVATQLIAIPESAELRIEVLGSQSTEYDLSQFGVTSLLMPAQPSLSKSDDPAKVPFEYNEGLYKNAGYYSLPTATSEISGTMRGLRVGHVSVAPVEYDPISNKVRVQSEITIRVNFDNPDWLATQKNFDNTYSPVFEPAYAQLSNYEMMNLQDKADLVKYPIKYVIISARMFESQLQPFIAWKVKKGFKVIVAYTDVIGTTTTAIKAYIQGLYNAGTLADPAPSFVLLVGDTPQIPSFTGSSGSHVTDLRYCEFTGDNLPEIYYGRFSAQTTAQLQPQIDKTLEYEQYLMPNPAYLGETTLIAGVDGSYAPTYGNGQINYGTNLYFNAAHGITPHVWLYPASDGAGASAAIIQTVNTGIAYINYTAHGSHDSWADPSFSVSDINGLTNIHEYGFAVGNCCVTNTFAESTPCFGEAWMQAANKGGIGYIGASNNSYWDEDYWWGVGGGKAIVAAGPAYDATKLGAYDGVFHDHGEAVTNHYITAYGINMIGNLAVEQSTSSRKQYYWEIYHLMGDPSVVPYMKLPAMNAVSHSASVLMTASTFNVSADPGSYVGITVNGVLHGAGYVDATGSVQISLAPFSQPATANIVVTAQNKIPYNSTVQVIAPSGPYVIYQSHTINDAAGNNNGQIDFGEAIVLGMQIQNVGPDAANNVVATLSTDDEFVTITDATENYGTIAGNFGNATIADAFAITFSPLIPDGHRVTFTVTVNGNAKDTWESTFNVTAHAPAVAFVSFSVNDATGNNNGMIDPGETANITVTLQNIGTGTSYNVAALLSELDTYLDITDADGTYGDIAGGGGTATNAGNVYTVTASASTPMGHGVNCKLAITANGGYAATQYFTLTVGDRVVFFLEDFSAEQGWTGLGGTAEWQIGPAVGGGGDPADDHSPSTDKMVMGNDLTSVGTYANSIGSTNWILSPIIDCSNATSIFMTYYHQLGVESSSYDHAYLEVYDGSAWIQLYANSATLNETGWTESVYDLSASADNNPEFQIRFGFGPTDGSQVYGGWNIDDISLRGYVSGSGGSSFADFATSSIADSLVEGEQAIQNVIVRNTGEATLRIRFVPTVTWLECSTIMNYVQIGDSLVLPVTFKGAGMNPGTYPGLLGYTSNDPIHATGNLNASLHIYAPLMVVTPATINKAIPVSGRDSVSVLVSNNGDGKLNYAIDCSTYDKFAFAKADALMTNEPIGYVIGDPDKGGISEPYFADMTKGLGGPDAFGNVWIDSDDPNGPAFEWIDIAATGNVVAGLSDDNYVGPFPIGFTFPYYGLTYTEFYLGSNGIIGFGTTTELSSLSNVALPAAGVPNNIIAWCWDDLNINDVDSPGGKAVYQVVNGALVISFIAYPEYQSDTNPGEVITAQVILSPDGSVKIQYQTIATGFDILGCTVGMENITGTAGLNVVYNANYLHNGLAIYMGPPEPTWMEVSSAGGSVAPHSSSSFWVYFDALDMLDTTCGGAVGISSNDPSFPLCGIPVTLRVGQVYMIGDANNDQTVNISDAVYIINYVFSGGPAPDPIQAADVDCSTACNISDAVYLISYVFGGGPAPCVPVG